MRIAALASIGTTTDHRQCRALQIRSAWYLTERLDGFNRDANPGFSDYVPLDDDWSRDSRRIRMANGCGGLGCTGSERRIHEPPPPASRHGELIVYSHPTRNLLASILAEAHGSAMARKLRLPVVERITRAGTSTH